MVIFQKIRTSNILSPNLEKEKGLFLKRVGELISEGYSIKNTLKFIDKFEKEPVKSWIKSIQGGLLTGSSFHEELGKIGFSSKVCSQIYLASRYGDYGETIQCCGKQLLEQEEMKKKLRSILSYPFLLLFFLLGMLMAMRFFILPTMANLFATNTVEADIYSNYLVRLIYYSPQIILLSLFSFCLCTLILWRKLDRLSAVGKIAYFMKWPFLPKYIKNYWTQFLFSEWGQLLRNGVSFQELVLIMSSQDASPIFQETGAILSREMSQGKSIKEALESLPFFKEEAMLVISHGENLGQLGTEMLTYSSYCEIELLDRIEKILAKLQPIIFIFIALMIIAIYAAMMLPIFTIMEGIQ